MRELKFRVWNPTDKILLYPEGQAELAISLNGNLFSRWDKSWMFNKWVIQQFTGLKDKNNKEIYEGDIVKFCYFDSWMNNDCEDICQIIFYNENLGAFRMGSQYVVDNHLLWVKGFELTSNCEVVGNIFENKELVK